MSGVRLVKEFIGETEADQHIIMKSSLTSSFFVNILCTMARDVTMFLLFYLTIFLHMHLLAKSLTVV